jgi:hypothetical protein
LKCDFTLKQIEIMPVNSGKKIIVYYPFRKAVDDIVRQAAILGRYI